MSDRIEREVEINAPQSRVWRALTDAEQFGQWFRVALEGPFVVGRRTAGRTLYPGYEHVRFEASVRRIEPEHTFAFAWHPFAVERGVDYSGEEPTLVTFTLMPTASGATRLNVVESGFDRLPPHRRDLAFRMNDGGWAEQLENVKRHVEG